MTPICSRLDRPGPHAHMTFASLDICLREIAIIWIIEHNIAWNMSTKWPINILVHLVRDVTTDWLHFIPISWPPSSAC